MSPNFSTYCAYDVTTVGIPAGPFTVGPTNAAPISPIPAGKNDKSFSLVNTPGLTIFSAISYLLCCYACNYSYINI